MEMKTTTLVAGCWGPLRRCIGTGSADHQNSSLANSQRPHFHGSAGTFGPSFRLSSQGAHSGGQVPGWLQLMVVGSQRLHRGQYIIYTVCVCI